MMWGSEGNYLMNYLIDVNDGGLTGQNQTISLIGGNNTVDITQAGTAQNQTVNLNLQTSGSDIDISQND